MVVGHRRRSRSATTRSLPADPVIGAGDVELVNEGESPHTFTIEGEDVDVEVDAGQTTTATVDLPAGDVHALLQLPSSAGDGGHAHRPSVSGSLLDGRPAPVCSRDAGRSDRGGQRVGRTVFHGGRVFDGTGAALADADVLIEDGRIVDVGPGLDGDEGVDARARRSCPACSTPMCTWSRATRTSTRSACCTSRSVRPSSASRRTCVAPSRAGSPRCVTLPARMPGCGSPWRRARSSGPRMQISVTMLSMTGGPQRPLAPERRDRPLGSAVPGDAERRLRRHRRRGRQGARGDPGRRRRDQDRIVRRVPLARPTIPRSRTSRRPRSRRSCAPLPTSGGG